jgi:superfamily II DNA or RNA helicase
VIPRPYQRAGIDECRAKFASGEPGVCLVAPVGSGKTCMGATFVAEVVAQGQRVAWGAHRAELLDQAADTLQRMGLTIGIHGAGKNAPVQLGSYQKWASRGEVPDVDYFVGDECHHLADRVGWQRIPGSYRAAGKRILGLTATPARPDGAALPDFSSLVVAAQIRDLQEQGYLVPLVWRGPDARMRSERIALNPVEAYQRETPGESAVVFAAHTTASLKFVEDFQRAGISCRFVTSDKALMSDEDRDAALASFAAGETLVLVNMGILTEGWDCPRCSSVIIARGCGSVVLLIQMAGRGLRPHPGKERMKLLDLAGVCHTLGRPDADAVYSLTGTGIVLSAASCPTGARLCKVCSAVLGDVMVCPDCGKDHAPKVPKALGLELTDWQTAWDAAKVATKPSPLVLSLAGILGKAQEAAAKGKPWSTQAPALRFRAIFKRFPNAQEYHAARNFLRAAEAYPVDRSDTNP